MTKNHLKRLCIPNAWKNIHRRDEKFITKVNPGPHPSNLAIPIDIALKQLRFASTKKEVKYLLHNKNVLVDGRKINDLHFAVGLFDVLSVESAHYRVALDEKGRLVFNSIQKNVNEKPVKVIGKKVLKKGSVQLNLSDGRNVLIDKNSGHRIGDTVVIELPKQKIKSSIRLDNGSRVLLTSGKHSGEIGVVENIKGEFVLYKKEKETISTLKKYAFALPEFI